MVNDFIPENALQEKYQLEFISTFWRNISLSLEELVPGGGTPSLKVVGRLPGTHGLKSLWAPKKGVKIICVAAELKNRGQKSICGHKKGGQ